MGCLLHCTSTSGLLTECGACPMYSVRTARNPFRGLHCCFLLGSLYSFRQACYCKHRACLQLTVQTSKSCLQAINCIRGLSWHAYRNGAYEFSKCRYRNDHRGYASESYSERVVGVCVPATTAGVERLFSISAFILSSRRLRLTDKNFEDQVFPHCNADLLCAVCRKRKSACFWIKV